MIQEIRVAGKQKEQRGQALHAEIIRTLGITSIQKIDAVKIYRLQGIDAATAQRIAQEVIIDPLHESSISHQSSSSEDHTMIEVGNKPGVMNPEVASLLQAISMIGIDGVQAADTSWEYHFYGTVSDHQMQQICDRLLVNKTVAQVVTERPNDLRIRGTTRTVFTVPARSMSLDQFKEYAQANQLFLSHAECEAIQHHFQQLGRDPYDAELETIAQTWSEHCCHKTFKAPLTVNGEHKQSLFGRLKKVAAQYNQNTISAFEDNAGVFRFYDGFGIAGKVETHNSPSAIEPYGGAATGSGGVFRDIMGTGLGAQVIASTDIFCFAPPTLEAAQVPPGCLHPDYLLRNVVAGVRDYGNRMGIPTNNGSVHFHEDFRAKPTVIVGAYGLIAEHNAAKGQPQIGDRIFTVGGKTGRDGIHGATFSSDAMTDKTHSVNATAVQIGNAIEQKRMSDALLAARDHHLIRAITDCGAGGFSSAIGEMAQHLGAHIELHSVPLKYAGLAPWEIWVSESQERMVCAVAPKNAQAFIELCRMYNTDAHEIGVFTGNQRLLVTYNGAMVCDLAMDFLHNGCPIAPLQITIPDHGVSHAAQYGEPATEHEWMVRLSNVLQHGNICSKEPIVRQYDHMVQGMNALAPYAGVKADGPQDASVLVPLYGKPYGLIISHGLNPLLNRLDPYAGTVWAIAEALSNLVAVGGNPHDAALIDNFIWPKPNNEFLWALDRAMDACVDAMHAFKIPFISGKDSLSSSYRYPDGSVLHIPPVLCISAFGKIPDVSRTISSDIKKPDSFLLLIGDPGDYAMGGSVYEQTLGFQQGDVPKIDLHVTAQTFAQLHTLITQGQVLSCHDISEGGLLVALIEMCFGGRMGAEFNVVREGMRLDHRLFAETAGCFVAEVDRDVYQAGTFDAIEHCVIGITTQQQRIVGTNNDTLLFDASLDDLLQIWQQPMKKVFNS